MRARLSSVAAGSLGTYSDGAFGTQPALQPWQLLQQEPAIQSFEQSCQALCSAQVCGGFLPGGTSSQASTTDCCTASVIAKANVIWKEKHV